MESPPSISITQPLPQTLLFFISNFHYLIPIKLTDRNYSIWKLQCEGALKASYLFDYIQQSQPPSPTILDSTGKTIANPMFFTWFVVEPHLRSCLIATLTPDVLTLVRHTSSARDLWVFLKQKFEKSNSFENFDLQDSCQVTCQICGNEGHGALDCSYRYAEDSQPANATSSYAYEVFDGSPDRNADGSAVSAAITGSDIVTPWQGTAVLSEPEMLDLNHADSSFVEDRLPLLPEEMIGCQTRQEVVNFKPFQKKPNPLISEAKEKVILMANHEMNHSGSKQTAPTPYCATDLSSVPLKNNRIALFCTPCQVSRVWACKQDTGKNNENEGSSKETGNAVEHTQSTNNLKIQNSVDAGLEGMPLPVCQKVNGGNTLEVFDASPDRNADESAVSGSDIVTPSQGVEVLSEPEMWDLNLSDSSFVEDRLLLGPEEMIGCQTRQEIVNFKHFQKKPEPLISEAKEIVILMTQPENNLSKPKCKVPTPPVDGASDTCADLLKKNQMVRFPANSVPSKGNNNDIGPLLKETRNAVENTHTTDDLKIPNSQDKNNQGGKSLPVYRRKDDKNIVLMGSTDGQKIQNSPEIQLEENSLQGYKQLNDQKIQNPQEIQVDGNALQVDNQLNGGKAVVHVGPSDDDLKTQNSPEIQVSLNKKLNSGKATIQVQQGNSLQVNGQLNGGKWISWSRPPQGMVALHFDGSLRAGSAAGGCVFRDHYGQFIAGFSAHLGELGPGTSNEAEAKALLSGLRFAHYWGIPVHCIYGDSLVVVQAVTATTVVTPWKLLSTVLEIRNLLNGAAISHTHREGNQVANELAARGHCLSSGFTKPYLVQEELPIPVRMLLFQDCNDCKTYRPS